MSFPSILVIIRSKLLFLFFSLQRSLVPEQPEVHLGSAAAAAPQKLEAAAPADPAQTAVTPSKSKLLTQSCPSPQCLHLRLKAYVCYFKKGREKKSQKKIQKGEKKTTN